MKNIIKTLLVTGALCIVCDMASAQSLKDLLNKAANSSVVKDVVESVTGVTAKADISGTWSYSGAAVKLESDDILKSAAANLAVSQVESKLDETLAKIGIKEGLFSYTFNADSTFTTNYKTKSFEGTYSISEDQKSIEMSYGKLLSFARSNATLSVSGNSLELLFKADKLLELLGKITANSNNTALKTLSGLASQYDGMLIGLELKK